MQASCCAARVALLLLTFVITVAAANTDDSDKHQVDKSPAEIVTDKHEGGDQPKGKSIAVIGGGSAGAMTAVELLRRKEVSKVTLIEQADRIGHEKSASGIIAALLIIKPQEEYWNYFDDVNDVLDKAEWFTHVGGGTDTVRLMKFFHRTAATRLAKDPRVNKAFQANFFAEGGKIVYDLINWKPELCEAIIGPFCCKEGTAAFKWMEDEGKKKGLSCDNLAGVAHTFHTKDDFRQAADKKKAKEGNWVIWGPETKQCHMLEDYLKFNLTGAVWQDHHEGFIRVELLFPILTKIFKESGKVEMAMNCHVKDIERNEDGRVTVTTDKDKGPDCKFNADEFDKVIVAAGAASVPLLAKVDKNLPIEIIPVKGFAIQSDHDFVIEKERMIAIEFEEPGQYIRSQANGGIRYGFGRVFGTFEDELLDPKFAGWDTKLGPKLTGLGREMLDRADTAKLAGMRPVSILGNFPIVKAYTGQYDGILLNSGFGFYGYGLTWKAAQIVVDVALTGKPREEEWYDAVDYSSGECPLWKPTCWQPWMYVSAIVGVLVLVSAGGFACIKKCGTKNDKVADPANKYDPLAQNPGVAQAA